MFVQLVFLTACLCDKAKSILYEVLTKVYYYCIAGEELSQELFLVFICS